MFSLRQRAENLLREHDIAIPADLQMEELIIAAVKVQHVYFSTVRYDPTASEVSALFDIFLLDLREAS